MKEKFPHSRKPSHWQVCGELWNLRGQHNRQEKKKKKIHTHIEYAPNCNSQQRSSPDACICYQQARAEQGGGLNREARAALLRVRTRPECPESNLRELM